MASQNDIMLELSDVVKEAVSKALADNPLAAASPKKPVGKGAGNKGASLNVGDIVAQVLAAVQPTLIALVNSGIASATQKIWDNMVAKEESTKQVLRKHEYELVSMKARVERQEQYSRRETIKIMNLPVTHMKADGHEDTDRAVRELASMVGVELTPHDISVSHRLPRRGPGVAPVVCRFTRRNSRTSLMMAKRKLRDRADEYQNVFVADHLTPWRARLLRKLKAHEEVAKVYSIEGKLRVHMKRPNNQEERVTIDSLDDLVALGLSTEVIEGLGIFSPLNYTQD